MELPATNNNAVDKMELHFVDRAECQIESPEKACLSPNSFSVSPLRDEQLDVESESQAPNKLELHPIGMDSEEKPLESDNRLDNCPELESGTFTERHEHVVSMGNRDTIISPTKASPKHIADLSNVGDGEELVTDESFEVLLISEEEVEPTHSGTKPGDSNDIQDIDTAKSHSVEDELDTVNNNLAQTDTTALEHVQPDIKIQCEHVNSNCADFQLVSQNSVKVVEDNVKLVPASPENSNVNLYWYSNTVALDPIEIQEFKKMQVQNDDNIGKIGAPLNDDYYYKSKLEVTTKLPLEENKSSGDTNVNMSSHKDEKSWSTVFQSASLRALDVASEQTSDPKDIKNRENTSIRESVVGAAHPWGLVADSRLIVDTSQPKPDVLPTLESLTEDIRNNKLEDDDQTCEVTDDTSNMNIEDVIDQKESSITCEVDEKILLQPDQTCEVTEDTSNMNIEDVIDQKESSITCEIDEKILLQPSEPSDLIIIDGDQTAAVGYMELKDNNEIKNNQLADANNVEANNVEANNVGDQTDAVGYMELNDKNEIKNNQLADANNAEANSVLGSKDNHIKGKELDHTKEKTEVISSETRNNTESAKDVTDSVDNMCLVTEEGIETVETIEDINLKMSEDNVQQRSESDLMIRTDDEDNVKTNTVDLNVNIVEPDILPDSNILSEMMISVDKIAGKLQKMQEPVSEANTDVKGKAYDPIEVERKFRITDDTEEKIRNLNGKLEKTVNFIDKYLDDSSYTLTLQDCWLRLRNNKYELKTNSAVSGSSSSTQYNETDNEDTIKELLIKTFDVASIVKKEGPLSDILTKCGLQEFAVFETTRKTFRLADCVVDLDQTDFGYQVGEIEVMVDSPAEVPFALDIIEKVAGQLGVGSGGHLGKLETYLKTNTPRHHDMLVRAGIFRPVQETDQECV